MDSNTNLQHSFDHIVLITNGTIFRKLRHWGYILIYNLSLDSFDHRYLQHHTQLLIKPTFIRGVNINT